MKRGAVRKKDSQLVTVWFPTPVTVALQQVVTRHDTDRSKFIRTAVREKLSRAGITVEEPL